MRNVSFFWWLSTSSYVSGKSAGLVGTKRTGIRPISPKSPVASASAFESVEGSDDEDNMTDNAKLGTVYHSNGNAVSLFGSYAWCLCKSAGEVQTAITSPYISNMLLLL